MKRGKKEKKYYRSKKSRKETLLRDAENPDSDLTDEARDFIRKTNGEKVPESYEVSHEKPLYTAPNNAGKAELDVPDNMKTVPEEVHRARHQICGEQYHFFGPFR